MKLIECSGFEFDNYRVPPFEVNRGEFIGISLLGGCHFYPCYKEFISWLTKKKKVEDLEVHNSFAEVKDYREGRIKSFIRPKSVIKYVEENEILVDDGFEYVLKLFDININSKMIELVGNQLRLLSLLKSFSKDKNIIFHMLGLDPIGSEKIIQVILEYTKKGYSAILLDNFIDKTMEKICNRYFPIEIINLDIYQKKI